MAAINCNKRCRHESQFTTYYLRPCVSASASTFVPDVVPKINADPRKTIPVLFISDFIGYRRCEVFTDTFQGHTNECKLHFTIVPLKRNIAILDLRLSTLHPFPYIARINVQIHINYSNTVAGKFASCFSTLWFLRGCSGLEYVRIGDL